MLNGFERELVDASKRGGGLPEGDCTPGAGTHAAGPAEPAEQRHGTRLAGMPLPMTTEALERSSSL